MSELAIRQDTAPAVMGAPAALIAWADAASAAYKLAAPLVTTDFVPAHFRPKNDTDEALALARSSATAAVMYGAEAGLSPMQALQGIYVIGGRPAMYARTLLAITLSQGHEVWTRELTDTRAVVCGRRRGSSHVEEVSFNADRANKAGYTRNQKYKTDPQSMLLARAQSEVCRRIAADAIAGIGYSVEELELADTTSDTTITVEQAAPAKRTMRRAAPVAVVPPEPDLDAEDPAVTDRDEPSESDPVAEPETGEAITKEQMKKLHVSFGDLGVEDRDARLHYSSAVIGREIETSNDLSKREASAVIDALASDIYDRTVPADGDAA